MARAATHAGRCSPGLVAGLLRCDGQHPGPQGGGRSRRRGHRVHGCHRGREGSTATMSPRVGPPPRPGQTTEGGGRGGAWVQSLSPHPVRRAWRLQGQASASRGSAGGAHGEDATPSRGTAGRGALCSLLLSTGRLGGARQGRGSHGPERTGQSVPSALRVWAPQGGLDLRFQLQQAVVEPLGRVLVQVHLEESQGSGRPERRPCAPGDPGPRTQAAQRDSDLRPAADCPLGPVLLRPEGQDPVTKHADRL